MMVLCGMPSLAKTGATWLRQARIKRHEIWDLASGKEVSRIIHPQGVMEVAFNGRRLATACRDGKVRVWLWHPEDLIAEACSRLTRNLTLEEWHQDLGDDIAYERTCPNLPEPEA